MAFLDVRTGERCEHAYATKDGAECKIGGRFALLFFFHRFVCIVRDFKCCLLHMFCGRPLRLAASRAHAIRCRESALGGADPELSLVASGLCFLPKAVMRALFSIVRNVGEVCAGLFL